MFLWSRTGAFCLLLFTLGGQLLAQEWSEAQVVELFLQQSPQTRELRARVAAAQAEARSRTLNPNPSFNYSREGAGFTEFFEAAQTLPITGRLGYLRRAGNAAVSATESESAAALWQMRSDLRSAFYRLLAAQEQEAILQTSIEKLREIVRILRDREKEGEGSRYDRLRAERELVELRTEVTAARVRITRARAELLSFLPAGTQIARVTGQLSLSPGTAPASELVSRALAVRADYRAAQQESERYYFEKRAADRLLIPEPTISAGLKRAETAVSPRQPGAIFSLSLPIPIFNTGRAEVTRFQAEQRRVEARREALTQQIRAQVEGAYQALLLRQGDVGEYQKAVAATGEELSRIAQVSYQEGEIGILELLDAYRVSQQSEFHLMELKAAVKEAQIDLDRAVGEEVAP